MNRVGDRYFDQLEQNGHATRLSDLDLFAELGVRALRYPVLWERTAPSESGKADWSWADERLGHLRRELHIRPIVGLVHHGSGPRHTSLVDSHFPEKLAAYARRVAERYEWIEDYTPVNEPLTTARFSGLYGHWYPHACDDLTFARAMLIQCRAIVLAMRAIREVNSNARLVQTEDLGKTFSTRTLRYQADFENERRWLTFDLLCGRVCPQHPVWSYLAWVGIDEKELAWFLDNPCPPDMIGINHYLTSERFLDERITRYPACTQGGNGRHVYADVEAVRVRAEGTAGPRALMREAWERFRLPLAVTECHLGCTREEQLRWFKEVWDGARSLRSNGADVRAVTAWSLLGAFDWCNLLTRAEGRYESGVYDLRAPTPRPTAIARMIRELAAGREHDHPVLDTPGWWRRMERFHYPPVVQRAHAIASAVQGVSLNGTAAARMLLITGATGTLGRAFARICELRGLPFRLLTRREMDIADASSVEAALNEFDAWAVVNTAGYVRVDDAESDAQACRRENTLGAKALAAACRGRGIRLVTFSSDLVFDGAKGSAYVESDLPAPLNVYGQTKAEAEECVLSLHPGALVIRTSAFFGPWDEYNFVTTVLRELSSGREFMAANDALVSPTYLPDLVNASLDLLIDGERGIFHLANDGEITWAELARRAANMAGLDERAVVDRQTHTLGLAAPRPLYSVLKSERVTLMPTLDDALSRYEHQCEVNWTGDSGNAQTEVALLRASAASAHAK